MRLALRDGALLMVLFMSAAASALAQTNSWLGGNGAWQMQGLWNLNQSPSSNQNIVVTNSGTFTVTVDDNTASNFPGTLTIQSLLASDSAGTSTILLTNRPSSTTPIALAISGNATISSGSALNAVDASSGGLGVTVQASGFTIEGSALVQGNGGFQGGGVNVGLQSGAHGVWQIAGGSNMLMYPAVQIGVNGGATGEVWMTSGLLQTPGNTLLGFSGGVGSLTVSNGTIHTGGLGIGEHDGSVGTVTIAGGTVTADEISLAGKGTGFLWLTGGELDITDHTYSVISIPNSFCGGTFDSELICSGGVLRASRVNITGCYPNRSFWSVAGSACTVGGSITMGISGGQDTLCLVSAGQLQTPQLFVNNGIMTISGGVVQVTQQLQVGTVVNSTGTVNVAGGELDVTNSSNPVIVGYNGVGEITVSSGGTLNLPATWIGGTIGAPGVLNVAGGTATVMPSYYLYIGFGSGSTGIVSVTGGTLKAYVIVVGNNSVGTLVVSNGTVDSSIGSSGAYLDVGLASGSTGTVLYAGGNLHAQRIFVGDAGYGSLAVLSNVDLGPLGLIVGEQNGAEGSVSIQGGTIPGPSRRQALDLEIGMGTGSKGTVWVVNGALGVGSSCNQGFMASIGEQGSGRLSATNSLLAFYNISVGTQGTLECVNSQLSVYGGCSVINNNVMLFIHSSGSFSASLQNNATIVANGSTLTFGQPVNNSGWIIATNGSLQFLSSVTNSGSVFLGPDQFHCTSIMRTGSDVAIGWNAFGGNHYRMQSSTNLVGVFSDISTDIVAIGNGTVLTNFLDAGAVTNSTRRFYRVRQIVTP